MPKAHRLLLINYEFPPLGGGAGTATFNIARELAAQGAEVTVMTSAFQGLPRRERLHGYDVLRIPTLRRRKDRCSVAEMIVFMLSACCHCWPILWRCRPTTVIAFFGIPCGPIAFLIRLVARTPYIISLRGGDVPGYLAHELGFYHRLTAPLTRIVWRHAKDVVANSNGLRDLAARADPSVDIKMIPNGVDLTAFRSGRRQNDMAAILFAGRLHRTKGLDTLLKALAQLPPALRPAWRLIVVGDGPERQPLAQLADELGLGSQVIFMGWIDRADLAGIYADADIFAYPSQEEGMPNAVMEAMAASLPVIGTRTRGSDEVIVDGTTGMLVEYGDIPALAVAVSQLLSDRDLRQRLGAAGRARVEASFSWRATAAAYLELAGKLSN
jgi:glycosyltransferase involved in cell wall biosynthesis